METKTFSSIFYLRNSRLDKNAKAGIYFRITVNGQKAELSIKRKTSPEKWCSVKGRIKGSSIWAKELNHYMDQLESKAYEIHSKLVVKKSLSMPRPSKTNYWAKELPTKPSLPFMKNTMPRSKS